MSVFIPELKRIQGRVLTVAPTRKHLKDLLEMLSYELTTKVGAGQKLEIRMAAPATGPIEALSSFTLGFRAGAGFRLSLMGMSLENGVPSRNAFEMADSFLFWMPEEQDFVERFLSAKIPDDARTRPCVVAGLKSPESGQLSLRGLALVEWGRRHFDQILHIAEPQDYLKDGLEWALSF